VDLLEGAVAGNRVLTHDHGDVVAIDAHAVVKQLAVCLVALGGGAVGIPRVACDRIAGVGHVKAGENRNDARHFLGLGRVDGHNAPVADRGVIDLCLEAGLGAQVIRELGASRHLVICVDAHDGATNLPELFHDASLSKVVLLANKILLPRESSVGSLR